MQRTKEELLVIGNKIVKNTLMETLEIEMVDFGDKYVVGRMPVNSRVHQPDGILHGGATAALAESVGSFAAHLFVDTEEVYVRGTEVTVNHLKSVRDGYVYAKATFIHHGRTTQLLDVRVTDDDDNLISICRLSTVSLPRKK